MRPLCQVKILSMSEIGGDDHYVNVLRTVEYTKCNVVCLLYVESKSAEHGKCHGNCRSSHMTHISSIRLQLHREQWWGTSSSVAHRSCLLVLRLCAVIVEELSLNTMPQLETASAFSVVPLLKKIPS
jgi:hypothetical protein